MWTNIYRIGGLHQLSWFQFLPNEPELTQLPDQSRKVAAEQKDCVGTRHVLFAHLQLQKEGFLSTWTNSFVGPWDPSQGLHNPDEKIKLWLFIPGRHSIAVDASLPFVSKLKVAASGVWLAPGDSEEVAAALSQALRNRIEKSLLGQSFLRYGDVFMKCNSYPSGGAVRKGQAAFELVFGAAEDGIYVHVIISAKHIRALSSSDMENVQKKLSRNSNYRFPVIVSPHGLRGWLTGSCPNDLVKQIFLSSGKGKTSNGIIGLPHHLSQGTNSQLWGQSYFAELILGCRKSESEKEFQSCTQMSRNASKIHVPESDAQRSSSSCKMTDHRKSFIYPVETVVIPVQQPISARSSLKRFWLQNLVGPSFSASSFFMHCGSESDCLEGNWSEVVGLPFQNEYNSSSNSNTSSISSFCSSSCDSDQRMATTTGELEADADSLSCRQSGLSTNDQFDFDAPKSGSKRPRTTMADTFGQSAKGSVQDSMDANNSTITGGETDFDWDDGGVNVNIQALLSEFGDFGGFFETDKLDFGEPPGTAESQVLMFSTSEYDVASSPIGAMDTADNMLVPVGFPPLESFNPSSMDDSLSKNHELAGGNFISGYSDYIHTPSSGEFDHLIKAEALMTFAPEYGAVETCSTDLSSSIFRTPYCPKSHMAESSTSSTTNYTYGAVPPSPCLDISEEKSGVILHPKTAKVRQDPKKFYNHVESKRDPQDNGQFKLNERLPTTEDFASSVSTVSHVNPTKAAQPKLTDGTSMPESNLFPSKTMLATDIECLVFQACMCRIRHLHLSSSHSPELNTSKHTSSNALHQFSGDGSIISENMSAKYDMKKKESIPLRIAGEVDGVLDSHVNSPVGVWRSVGVPKVMKTINSSNVETVSSLPHLPYADEGLLSFGQRQPLQELLIGIPILVQQAASFVDVALDGCCNDGPFSWLALQEQWRRGFCCGPSAVHAGCGGTLAASHFLDVAGVELADPFHAEILASTVIGLLQNDIKTALKAAFKSLEGPLSVGDWFKRSGSLPDVAAFCDGSTADSSLSECKDSSSTVSPSVGESLSPAQSSVGGSFSLRITEKGEESSQRRVAQDIEMEHLQSSRIRPSPLVVPTPAILAGYQDDWLKTSASSIQFWEKASFEPYALPKPITYFVVCPEIDPLTSASVDFFQQLGTVYETCKLGSHLPQCLSNEVGADAGKWSSSGFVLLDCPQSMKIESTNASLVGSLSDYFLSLSNGWDLSIYLKSLSKAIRALKLPFSSTNAREGNSGSCTVVYVVCPFPEPIAVLQTIVEASTSLGSVYFSHDRERKSALHSQVAKALSCSLSFDESSASNVVMLSGFSIPKLVLQIVTVDAIFRVTNPAFNELVALKEIAFTVYNKVRRISKGSLNDIQFSTLSSRSSNLIIPQIGGIWKDCIGPRIAREGDIDSGLRAGSWDNSWQTRTPGLNGDQTRNGDYFFQEDIRYMFEPLFILSQPGSLEHAVSPMYIDPAKHSSDDIAGASAPSGSTDTASTTDLTEDGFLSLYQKANPSLHCCYGWTEDWRWLVCVWTDARGELLDSNIFPFGGISSRQDTKGLQCVFMQIFQHGCQILHSCSSPDMPVPKPRDFIISRIGGFFELEYLEWQKAIYAFGGSEMKKWPVQLRRSLPDGSANSNGTSLQPQDMGLIQDRTLPSSITPLYSVTKSSTFIKNTMGQSNSRKHVISSHVFDNTRGILQSVQSITFATISVDHSLQLTLPTDPAASGGQSGNAIGGSSHVKSLGSSSSSYILIPSSNFRFLTPKPLQLPTCLTAESPPLAHLLHSRGSVIPISTGFVVSKAVPGMRSDDRIKQGEEWPATLAVGLVDYYGGATDKAGRGGSKQGDVEIPARTVLESLIAEVHALSWMTASPLYLDRRTALPFHCDMVLRLGRLLHFADKEVSSQDGRSQV